MAIYHLHAQTIGRGNNRSSVAAAAYRAACKLVEKIIDRESGVIFEREHNYSNKKGVIFSAILSPDHAPIWVHDREILWNKIQNDFEKRKKSQFCRELDIALPKELSIEQNVQLLKDFVNKAFIEEGMIADVNYHNDNPENPHAHIMLTMRELIKDENGEYTFGNKVRHWNSTAFLVNIRRLWAGYINKYLELAGVEQEVSYLSHEERGLNIKPTIKEWTAKYVENSDRLEINRLVNHENIEKIRENPELILDKFRKNKVVFTKEEIAGELFKLFSNEDVSRFTEGSNETKISHSIENIKESETTSFAEYIYALDKVMSSEKLVLLGSRDINGKQLYTCRDRHELERSFIDIACSIKTKEHMLEIADADLDKKNLVEKVRGYLGFDYDKVVLSDKQREIVLQVANGDDVSVVQGLPGAGKTITMREVVRQYRKAGYRVLGTAVSSSAARELGMSADIRAVNITKFRYELDKYAGRDFSLNLSMDYYKRVEGLDGLENLLSNKAINNEHETQKTTKSMLNNRDVLIVDESSMVDLAEMHYLLREVKASGAKLILVGDSNQLPSVGTQGAIEKMAEMFGVSRLDEVRRQEIAEHRNATKLLSEYKIAKAIDLYRNSNVFRFDTDICKVKEALIKDYVDTYSSYTEGKDKNKEFDSKKDVISNEIVALAYTNKDVLELNLSIREKLINKGLIRGQEIQFNVTRHGEHSTIKLARGEQVVFTRNETKYLGVANSDVGEVMNFGKSKDGLRDTILVKVFDNPGKSREIEVDNYYFKGLDYGYAVNIYKSQGKTYDSVFALIDSHTGYNTFNVIATRHTRALKVYASDDVINDELYKKISLDSTKAKEEYDIKSDYKDNDSRRYAGLVALIQKRGDVSLSKDYESKQISSQFEVLEKYVDVRNEVINVSETIDSWLMLERAKGRIKQISDSPYFGELKPLLEERKELALTIADNYFDYQQLLSQSKINYNTVEKHAGLSEYKYYFTKKEYSGSIKGLEGFDKILECQRNLSKYIEGDLFNKQIYKEAAILQEASTHLVEEMEEHRLAIAGTRSELRTLENEKYIAENYVREGQLYLEKDFKNYLGKTFKDSPDKIIRNWELIKTEKGRDKGLAHVKETPQALGKLVGIGIRSFALTSSRERAAEHLEVIADKFSRYEEYKTKLPEYENKLSNKAELNYDSQICKKEQELKALESKLLSKSAQAYIHKAYEASNKAFDSANEKICSNDKIVCASLLDWAKDSLVAAKSDQYREILVKDLKNSPQEQINISSSEYLKKRESLLTSYEYSKGTDARRKLYRNIAGSLQPDLAYEILKNISLKSISQDKAEFLLTDSSYNQTKLDKLREPLLACVQNTISYDIQEVEFFKPQENERVGSHNANKESQYITESLKASEEEFIKRALSGILLNNKIDDEKDNNHTFTAGDHLRLEIEADRISKIIVNERIKSGKSIKVDVSREELLGAQELYKTRDYKIEQILSTNPAVKELYKQNEFAGKILAENLVDRQMQSDSFVKAPSFKEFENLKYISLEQASIIKNTEMSQQKEKNNEIFTTQVLSNDHRDKIEYVKFLSNKHIANEIGFIKVKSFDVMKAQTIINESVKAADHEMFKLQKQYKVARQQELQDDRIRQMNKDRGFSR